MRWCARALTCVWRQGPIAVLAVETDSRWALAVASTARCRSGSPDILMKAIACASMATFYNNRVDGYFFGIRVPLSVCGR